MWRQAHQPAKPAPPEVGILPRKKCKSSRGRTAARFFANGCKVGIPTSLYRGRNSDFALPPRLELRLRSKLPIPRRVPGAGLARAWCVPGAGLARAWRRAPTALFFQSGSRIGNTTPAPDNRSRTAGLAPRPKPHGAGLAPRPKPRSRPTPSGRCEEV